jgi:ABC-2 type transport system permease protein
MARDLFVRLRHLGLFILRRDRLQLAIWIFAIASLNVMVALAYDGLYQNAVERATMAEIMQNPAMTFMLGPGYGLDDYTIGAMMGHQMLLFSALGVAIMNILLVARHSRADEEAGRTELIRSLPVGRLASLGAILVVAVLVNIGLALVVSFSLFACQVESVTLAGSLLYGFLLGVVGFLFAAITALLAQMTESSRGTLGYSLAALGLCYIVRGVGDVSSELLAILSPLGMILRAQVYVNNLWWPVYSVTILGIIFAGGAFFINSRRDLGGGLISARPGRTTASTFLRGPFGLALNLQQTTIIAWLVGLFLLGLSYGSVFGDVELFLEGNEFLRDILPMALGFTLTEQFLALLMSILAMLATVPALLVLLKVRAEEGDTHVEQVLATAISRTRILLSFVSLGVVVGLLSLVLSGLGLWLAANGVMDESISVMTIMQASLAQFPAILVMLALATFLFGWWPQYINLVWLYFAYSLFTVYFGVLLKLPTWLKRLSPFGVLPQMPIEPFEPIVALWLIAFFVIVLLLGLKGFTRRDLNN